MPQAKTPVAFPYQPRLIQIQLVGATPLYKPEERLRIVDALGREEKLGPELWAFHDSKAEPFDRDKFAQALKTPNPIVLFVRRRRQFCYEMCLSVDHRPRLTVEFHPAKLKPASLPIVFTAGDLLAEAFRCDFGWVHLHSSVQLSSPAADPEDILQEYMDQGCNSHHSYRERGPGGLGFRTYLGPAAVEKIGEYVRSLPAPFVVRELSWGGLSVDLVPDPWLADAKTLHAQWAAAMKHLSPAEYFATPLVKPNGAVQWTKGSKCKGLCGVKED